MKPVIQIIIIYLNLSSFGLKGTLYNLNFSSFPKLHTLCLSQNSLYGTIPDSIGDLSKLTHLDFSRNNLSGTFPSSIFNLSKLRFFHFSRNQISGRIPPR